MLKQYSDFVISVEKTAINRGVSMSCRMIIEELSKKQTDILDYGAGKLRNAKYLNSKGLCVDVLDTPIQTSKWSYGDFYEVGFIYDDAKKITKTYDAILCSFVLNVLPDRKERLSVLNNIKNLLDESGVAVVETRSGDTISSSKTAQPYKDGFLMGRGKIKTFQKSIDVNELVEMSMDAGFKVVQWVNKSESSIVILRNYKSKNTNVRLIK